MKPGFSVKNIATLLNSLAIYSVCAQEYIIDSVECIAKQSENRPFVVLLQLPENEEISFLCYGHKTTQKQFLSKSISVSSSSSSPSFDFFSDNSSSLNVQLIHPDTKKNQVILYQLIEGNNLQNASFKSGFIPSPFKSLRENPPSFSEGCLRIVIDSDSSDPAECSVIESRSVAIRQKIELETTKQKELEQENIRKIQRQESVFLTKISSKDFSFNNFFQNMDLIIFTSNQKILRLYEKFFTTKTTKDSPDFFSFTQIAKRLLGRDLLKESSLKAHLQLCQKMLNDVRLFKAFDEKIFPTTPESYTQYDGEEYLLEVAKKALSFPNYKEQAISILSDMLGKQSCSKTLKFLLSTQDIDLKDLKKKAIEVSIDILLDEFRDTPIFSEIIKNNDDIREERLQIFSVLSEAWDKFPNLEIRNIFSKKSSALEKKLLPNWDSSYCRFLSYVTAIDAKFSNQLKNKAKILLESYLTSEQYDEDLDKNDILHEFYDILGEDHLFVKELENICDNFYIFLNDSGETSTPSSFHMT